MTEKAYQVLEHQADLRIRVWGKDLADLFVQAGLALAQEQAGQPLRDKAVAGAWESVELKAADLASLLVDWLNEIIYRSEVNQAIYLGFRIEEISAHQLKAQLKGIKTKQKEKEIKGATYHRLEISQDKNGQWQALITFDI